MQCEVSSRLQPTNNPAVVVVVEVVVVVVQTCFSQTHSLPTSSTQDKQSNLACYWLDAVWLWFQWCAHSLIMMQQALCPEACNTLQQSWWWGIVCRKLQPVRARVWLWVILCWALYTIFLQADQEFTLLNHTSPWDHAGAGQDSYRDGLTAITFWMLITLLTCVRHACQVL